VLSATRRVRMEATFSSNVIWLRALGRTRYGRVERKIGSHIRAERGFPNENGNRNVVVVVREE